MIEVEQSRVKGTLAFVSETGNSEWSGVKVTINHGSGSPQVRTEVRMTPAEAMALLGAVEMGSEVVVVKTITIERVPARCGEVFGETVIDPDGYICDLPEAHHGPHIGNGEVDDEEPTSMRCHLKVGHVGSGQVDCEYAALTTAQIDADRTLCASGPHDAPAPKRDATIRRNARPACGAESSAGAECDLDPDHDGLHQSANDVFSTPGRDATIRRNARPLSRCEIREKGGGQCGLEPDHDGPHKSRDGYFS